MTLYLPVFLPTFLLTCLLSGGAVRSQTTTVPTTAELKQALQLKLDEWHKAGSFPGATMGVVLANGNSGGESFALAVGFSDRELKTPMKSNERGKSKKASLTAGRQSRSDSTTLRCSKEG